MKTLYYNGSILTLDGAARPQALLTENGRIAALGDKTSLETPDAHLVNLRGAALLPGFIDPHSHLSQVASGLMQVSLSGAADEAEIARRIQTFIDETQPDWVMARDFDGAPLPLEALDRLAPGHPLVIQYQSGHMGLFNSAALSALGVTADTPSPEGGRIGVENGALTGYLEENAYFAYMRKAPMAGLDAWMNAYAQAQRKYASHGITTVQEGMYVEQMAPMYQALLRSGLLRLDLVAYAERPAFESAKAAYPNAFLRYDGHFKLGGVKIFLDGSPQGRTAWMRQPYADDPAYFGYGTLEDAAVMEALELAAHNRCQLLAHCNGDAAAAQFIRCVAQVEERLPELKALRPVIIHAQLLGLDQAEQAAQLGMAASFFTAHTKYWGDTHIRNFGMERASLISPAATAKRVDLPFTFHQDAPVIEPDMLETVQCAAERRTRAGVALGPQERVSVEDALIAVTRTAAWQYFEEHEKGTLTPGKRADLTVLSRDPLQTPIADIGAIQVLQTIKDGETVYEA
ncbi:MAG: amidohydrolase [Eubacteriales bacterium]|nr:amidohydrolase [Eubacteriales bacterium]